MFDKKVILILFVSLFFAVIIALLTENEMEDEKNKALFIHKTHTNNTYNLIVAGDSRVYRGVSAKIMGDILHMNALNLGYSSGGHGKDLFDLIDKRLDRTGKRKIVILGITPFSLTDKAIENGHLNGVLSTKKETVLEYQYLFKLKNFFAPTSPAKIRKDKKEKDYNKYRQEIYIDEGWIASWYDKQVPYLALKDYKKTFTETKISEITIQNLYTKVQEWKKEGIEIYGFFVPSSVNMVELEKNVGKFKPNEFLKGFIEAGGKWINIENTYTSYDGSHLDKESAIRLSEELANKIKSKLLLTSFIPNTTINDIYVQKYDKRKIQIFSSQMINSSSNFADSESLLYSICTDSLLKNNIGTISIKLSIFYSDPQTNTIFGCQINHNNAEINCDYSTVPNKWCHLFLNFNIPEDINPDSLFKVYMKNPDNKNIKIDSLTISFVDNF